jgi:putative endonuclease
MSSPSIPGSVYILKSLKDEGIYIGSSRNLINRIKQHHYGKVKSTKGRRPLKLIYQEHYSDYSNAIKREKYLKSGAGRDWLKNNNII